MKPAKIRKMHRAIVANKVLPKQEAARITAAQIKIRDDKWSGHDSGFWPTLISHWQPIK